MKSLPLILVVDDNPDFGGHQVMSGQALEGLLETCAYQIHAWLHPGNCRNMELYQSLAGRYGRLLTIRNSPTRTRKWQGFRNYISFFRGSRVSTLVNELDPDLILVIQGNIEQSSAVLTLPGPMSCPRVSYIPLPHDHREMGAKLGWIRDLFCRNLYRRPDGFITLSPTLAKHLKMKGAKGRISVVENGICLERFESLPDPAEARQRLGLPVDSYIWGVVGRVEYSQKGQDFALNCFKKYSQEHTKQHLLFVGSGPDADDLKKRTAGLDHVSFIPWTDDLASIYSAIDTLLMPSRYEGVPLVMLEALACSRSVLATNRDGMKDWLPAEWLFEYQDAQSLLKSMIYVASHENSGSMEKIQSRIWSKQSIGAFKNSFERSVKEWIR